MIREENPILVGCHSVQRREEPKLCIMGEWPASYETIGILRVKFNHIIVACISGVHTCSNVHITAGTVQKCI